MKVLYVIHDTLMAGSNISLLNLVRGLVVQGVSVVVAGPDITVGKGREQFFLSLQELGITYHGITMVKNCWPPLTNWKYYVRFPLNVWLLIQSLRRSKKQLLEVVKQEVPDIIHTNSGVCHIGYEVSKQLAIPHVWHIREYQDRGLGWHFFPTKRSFIRKLKDGNHVVTITQALLDYFQLTDAPHCQCIYNGIYSLKDIKPADKRDKYLLCASQIIKLKGHEDVIRAFADFYKRHRDYTLVILGFGQEDFVNGLKQLTVELGCVDAVKWEGYKTNVQEYMQKAKALVVASWAEGFGRMTAEACMLGCMPIGRNVDGTKEILDYTGGLPFVDTAGLIQQMERVAAMSDDEYLSMTKVISDKAQQAYSNENNLLQTYNLYKDIIDARQ